MGKPGIPLIWWRIQPWWPRWDYQPLVCAVVSQPCSYLKKKKNPSISGINWVNRWQLFSLTVALKSSPCGPPRGSMWLLCLKIQSPLASLSPQGPRDHPVLGECVYVRVWGLPFLAPPPNTNSTGSSCEHLGVHLRHIYQCSSSPVSLLSLCTKTQSNL